jgi:PAS domain-containing protein
MVDSKWATLNLACSTVIETITAIAWTTHSDGSVDVINKRWPEYTGRVEKPVDLAATTTRWYPVFMKLRAPQALRRRIGREALGLGWQVALHPKDIDRFVEKRRASLESGNAFEDEVRIRSREDGEYGWFLCRATPLRDKRETSSGGMEPLPTLSNASGRRRDSNVGNLYCVRRLTGIDVRGDRGNLSGATESAYSCIQSRLCGLNCSPHG